MPIEENFPQHELSGNQILDEVCAILQQYNRTNASLDRETKITYDLDIDSVGVMDVVMEIEEKFNIDIPVNLLADIETIGDLADIVIAGTREK